MRGLRRTWGDFIKEHKWSIGLFAFCVIALTIVLAVSLSRGKGGSPSPPAASKGCYMVGKGQTLSGIATQLNIALQDLEAANPSISPENLQIGQRLVIPKGICHTVVAGDTCYQIASQNQITLDQLKSYNAPDLCGTDLQPGQTLLVGFQSPSTYSPCPDAPLGPTTGIKGYFYGCNKDGDTNQCGCVNSAQQSSAPTANLAALFIFDAVNETPSTIQTSMQTNPNYWTVDYRYSGPCSCAYRAYTLGGATILWVNEAKYVDAALISGIVTGGYNTIIFDVEQPIEEAEFVRIIDIMKQYKLTVMLYSMQYASKNFATFSQTSFAKIDYGIPSIYGGDLFNGNCNYASICSLDWWLDHFGSESKLILGITVGTWDKVSKYSYTFNTVVKTVADGQFAGYIEWIYSTGSCSATTSVICGSNPC